MHPMHAHYQQTSLLVQLLQRILQSVFKTGWVRSELWKHSQWEGECFVVSASVQGSLSYFCWLLSTLSCLRLQCQLGMLQQVLLGNHQNLWLYAQYSRGPNLFCIGATIYQDWPLCMVVYVLVETNSIQSDRCSANLGTLCQPDLTCLGRAMCELINTLWRKLCQRGDRFMKTPLLQREHVPGNLSLCLQGSRGQW